MGVCVSKGAANRETKLNRAISKEQMETKKVMERKVKLLILGAGDSGKTTWRRQMMNIHSGQFATAAVRKESSQVIVANLILGCQEIIRASQQLSIPIQEPEAQNAMDVLIKTTAQELTQELAKAINTLTSTPTFWKLYELRSSFQLQDCWKGFADSCKDYPVWGGPDWVPTVDECVRARVRTSGIVVDTFEYNNIKFELYDTGGQRAERRKWIHCFDSVTALIFIAASNEYDLQLFEDRSVNRLVEAVNVFKELCVSKWFVNTPVILFLNKKDLFYEKFKVKKVPLNISGLFPDAPTDNEDVDGALNWIAQQFIKVKPPNKDIFVHHTTATDPKNVRTVFNDSAAILLHRNLDMSGLS